MFREPKTGYEVSSKVELILCVVCKHRPKPGEFKRQLETLREITPCPTCSQNYKAYKKKVEALEAKAHRNEERAEELLDKNAYLLEKMHLLAMENQNLRERLNELSWKVSFQQSQTAQIYTPALSYLLGLTQSYTDRPRQVSRGLPEFSSPK